MSEPAPFELTEHKDYLEARMRPAATVDLLLRQCEVLVKHIAELKPSRLLVDLSGAMTKLTTLERYEMGMIGSKLAPHVGRSAVVAPGELIDSEKFGMQVARNRGLNADIFSDRDAALAWLLAMSAGFDGFDFGGAKPAEMGFLDELVDDQDRGLREERRRQAVP